MKVLYTAKAKAIGGREGSAKSSDGLLDVKLTPPKELGGMGGATNPEQLFAAGYAACFESAVRHVARSEKISISESSVSSQVSIGPKDDGGFQLAVALEVSLPGVELSVAQNLVEKAHQVCPYSHATRGNIEVKLAVK